LLRHQQKIQKNTIFISFSLIKIGIIMVRDFVGQVAELVEKLNLSNIEYESTEFDSLIEEFSTQDDKYEIELIEHYTGPCIEILDDLAARGEHDACILEHKKARETFLRDGGCDIIRRNLESEHEETIVISWQSSPGITVPRITDWKMIC